MKFNQLKDGSCEIFFSDNEIKIINDKKNLKLNAESLRHFNNNLMKILVELNDNLPENKKNLQTTSNTIIEGE